MLDGLPPEEKTEDRGIDWSHDQLDGATYGDHPIVAVHFWFDRVNVWYDYTDDPVFEYDGEHEDSVAPGWGNITFSADVADDGTIKVVGDPPRGVPGPVEARESDTPGANSAKSIYDLLRNLGIGVEVNEA